MQDVQGLGQSGMAALDPTTKHIIKFPFKDEERANCNREREIYQRLERSSLPRPSSLLKFYGSTDHGILLEYAEHGTLRRYLNGSTPPLPLPTLLSWAKQAAEALQFIHANGIMHGDVDCRKFFITECLDLKVGDFTRSSDATPEGVRADISDFGSALYEQVTGYLPYPGLPQDEKERMFRQMEFPDLTTVEVKGIIFPCWAGHYTSFAGVLEDIEQHIRALLGR